MFLPSTARCPGLVYYAPSGLGLKKRFSSSNPNLSIPLPAGTHDYEPSHLWANGSKYQKINLLSNLSPQESVWAQDYWLANSFCRVPNNTISGPHPILFARH